MKSYAEADLPEFSPFSGDTQVVFREKLRAARAAGSLANGAIGPLVIRHEAVTQLLHDKRLRGPGMDLARMSGIPEGSRTWRRQQNILLFMEGEDHHRLRRLVSKAFTPRAVEGLRPYTRSVIRKLLGAVFEAGRCDAVPALCNPFPIPVICALVGIEPDRIDDMSRWAGSILLALRFDAGSFLAEIEQAQAELDQYIDGLIEARRNTPRDDLLSRLIAVEEAGDRLSRVELQAVVAMMLVAGTDTTRNQLGNMIHTFAEHPNEWAMVRARPDLVHNAVEEAIRWEPATQAIPRFALEDVEVDGLLIPKGSFVGLMSLSANHDESTLPGADRFDITRESPNGWQLLTFGGGIHYCLGANLARVELTEALAELSSRFATLRLDGDPVPNPPGSVIMGYKSLPIAWTGAA
jgi:cytochrome P450